MPTTPPHSEAAERALLACCMVDGAESVLTAEAAGISEASFYVPANGMLFSRFRAMVSSGIPLDLVTACRELQKAGELDSAGGFAAISTLAESASTTALRAYHIEDVSAKARLRAIRGAAMALREAAEGEDTDRVSDALKSISVATAPQRALSSIADACRDARQQIEDEIAGRKTRGIFGFGMPGFDHFFGQLRRGELVCVAARPGVGKTSICIGAAVRAAMAGLRIRFYGLEMGNDELVTVAAGQLSGHSPRTIATAHPADRSEFFDALDVIAALKTLTLIDCDRSHDEIVSRTRAASLRGQIDGVFVDYLQRINPPRGDKDATRAQRIGLMTRDLKQLARDVAAPVVIAAQLNRAAESDDREPRMSDLRESGDIEADCDRVILLHRPAVGLDKRAQDADSDTSHIRIITDKNRKGPTGPAWASFHRPTQRFTEIKTTT